MEVEKISDADMLTRGWVKMPDGKWTASPEMWQDFTRRLKKNTEKINQVRKQFF